MLRVSRAIYDGICAITYVFDKTGDTLHVHVHAEPSMNHATIVVRGELMQLGRGEDGRPVEQGVLRANAYVVWPLGAPHGFRALTDDASLINLRRAKEGEAPYALYVLPGQT